MRSFSISATPIDAGEFRRGLADSSCGGYVQFEGWVRDHNEGQQVLRLEYEVYEPLAVREGLLIIGEAMERFAIARAAAVHRSGLLELSDLAVIVGVSAPHRGPAFDACRYIIDQAKLRLPIWKKEHYANGAAEWVNCRHCAAAGHAHGP
jgi:molybdopterin synthase catalytic subunit